MEAARCQSRTQRGSSPVPAYHHWSQRVPRNSSRGEPTHLCEFFQLGRCRSPLDNSPDLPRSGRSQLRQQRNNSHHHRDNQCVKHSTLRGTRGPLRKETVRRHGWGHCKLHSSFVRSGRDESTATSWNRSGIRTLRSNVCIFLGSHAGRQGDGRETH